MCPTSSPRKPPGEICECDQCPVPHTHVLRITPDGRPVGATWDKPGNPWHVVVRDDDLGRVDIRYDHDETGPMTLCGTLYLDPAGIADLVRRLT